MREIAEECFALVREYKGSHSGEHGDGIVRSEFNEPMFGSKIARAFEAVKDEFDPKALLNPAASCARRRWMTARCSATRRSITRMPR
jgi:FAD/FMN-containing dehydrogenase